MRRVVQERLVGDDRRGFFAANLDPSSTFKEILFGLVVVLTVTLGAGLTIGDDRDAVRTLLAAALGCNIATGIMDGATHVMGKLLERGRRDRMLLFLKDVPNEAAALAAIGRELDPRLADITTEEERKALYRGIYGMASRAQPHRVRIRRSDVMGGVASGVLVLVSTLPGAVPFMVMHHPVRALRTSNLILVVLLFLCGFLWARFTGLNRWFSGLVTMLTGLSLVGVSKLIGG